MQSPLGVAIHVELETWKFDGAGVAIDIENHFDERDSVRIPRHLKLLENFSNTALVVIVRVQDAGLHGRQVFLETFFGPKLRPNRQEVHAMSHQTGLSGDRLTSG